MPALRPPQVRVQGSTNGNLASRRRAAFKARETGDIPIARRWSTPRGSVGCGTPRRNKKVIGTRETGDRRRSSMICNRFCHPFHGFHIFYYQTRGFRLRPAGYAETGTPLAMDMSPTYVGYKFRSPAARQIPIYRAPCSNFGTRVAIVRSRRSFCFTNAA